MSRSIVAGLLGLLLAAPAAAEAPVVAAQIGRAHV